MNNIKKEREYLPKVNNLPTDREAIVFIASTLDSKEDKELATPFEILKTYFASLKNEVSAYEFLLNLDCDFSLNLKSEVRKVMNENNKNVAFLMKALVDEKNTSKSTQKKTVGDFYKNSIKK